MVEGGDILRVFDGKLTQLEIALCVLKRTLDVYKIVSLNCDGIKKVGGVREFFAHVQRASLESLVLGICRVFEKPGRKTRALHSLPGVLCVAETLPIEDAKPLQDFSRRYASDDNQRQGYVTNATIGEVRQVYARFWTRHQTEFHRMRTVRNMMIAHAEYVEEVARPRQLPSYDFMERLLLFAVDMNAALLEAYVHVSAHRIADDGLAASSTRALLQKLGIDNVKMRFDDDE